jgi:hypothetical protein
MLIVKVLIIFAVDEKLAVARVCLSVFAMAIVLDVLLCSGLSETRLLLLEWMGRRILFLWVAALHYHKIA